jgi:hypothetical protein
MIKEGIQDSKPGEIQQLLNEITENLGHNAASSYVYEAQTNTELVANNVAFLLKQGGWKVSVWPVDGSWTICVSAPGIFG